MEQHEDIYQEQPDFINEDAPKEEYQEKKESFWEKTKSKAGEAKDKVKEAAHWCGDHAGELVVMGFLGAGLLVKGMTEYNKMADRNDRHKNVKPSRIYDYRGHAWIDLKRPMNNREKEEFNSRYYDGGEDPYEILRDMRLLR